MTRGLRESASRGFYVSANIPYGYRKIKVKDRLKERPKLEIETGQAEIVARLFRRVIENKSLREIAQELNDQGIPSPKGKQWTKTAVAKLLSNETYTGTLVWGKVSKHNLEPLRIEKTVPAIVDRETYFKVQAILKSKTPRLIHPRRVASHYLLSGLVKCGYCGKALVGQDAKSGKFAYYVCNSLIKKGAGNCRCRCLNRDKFERIVIEKIKENILTEENLRNLVKLVNEETGLLSSDLEEEFPVLSIGNDGGQ